jgi:hypothetical protein
MKTKIVNIFWGIVLIVIGALFLLNELGVIMLYNASALFWALAFGAGSLFFLATYFLKSGKEWGWLFPATIFAGIALIIGFDGTRLGRILDGAPVLLGVAIPFAVAYFQDPQKKQWALIPAWVMTVLTLIILFERFLTGNLVGAIVLYSIALPFLYVYLTDKTRQWALIPFTAMVVVGTIPLLAEFLSGAFFDIVVVALLALPFYGVYFWAKKNWWAIIPAGVFTSIAVGLLINRVFRVPFPAGLFLGGLGLTFGVLWLLREKYATDWAKYPAAALLITALIVFLTTSRTSLVGPIVLVLAGAAVLIAGYIQSSRKKVKPGK